MIPFPIPASIYGLILLVAALAWKFIPFEWVTEVGGFLVKLLPILFIVPTVGILSYWDAIAPYLIPIETIVVLSTVITFAVSGFVTQRILGKRENDEHVYQ